MRREKRQKGTAEVKNRVELERRNRMTNLEYYKDEIKEEFLKHHYLGDVVYRVASNNGYKFYRNSEDDINLIDWLLEEHKEPIKLKQWEYDLIRTNDRPHECNVFESFNTYRNMKAIGYFEGITDTSMTLKEILENCEVVE